MEDPSKPAVHKQAPDRRSRQWGAAAFWVLIAAIALSYFQPIWSAAVPIAGRSPTGYYGTLTEAFLAGQLSLKANADPRLLALKNPYLDRPEIPRPHDVSFYKGKFYLYFGAAPVVLLFLPWRCLTGTWLSESAATALFCLFGVVAAALLVRRIRGRCFPRCADGWLLLFTALLAWGSPVFFLVQEETFYVVPVSAAFFCSMVGAYAIWRGLDEGAFLFRCAWIVAASLACGLAVGCRPNYAFSLPILLVPLGYLLFRPGMGTRIRERLYIAAAALVPAAAVGAAIAVYNFRRFESPFEFGARYAFMGGGGDMRHASLMGLGHFWANVGGYLFSPAYYVRYFPFLLNEGPFGAALFLPAILLGPLFILGLCLRYRAKPVGPILVAAAVLLGMSAGNLASLGFFYFFGAQRYMADFAPAALLLGVLGGCWLISERPSVAWARGLVGSLVLGLCALSLFNGSLAALQDSKSPVIIERMGRWLDYPAFWVERALGEKQGPMEIKFDVPAQRLLRREPLLSTGVPGRADILYLEYLEGGRARIGYFHLGLGGPVSDAFPLSDGPHRATIAMGSLYPPKEHPLFRGYSPGAVGAFKRRLTIALDGRTLVDSPAVGYFSTPGLVHVGENPFAVDVSVPKRQGRIEVVERLGMPVGGIADAHRPPGPIRLNLHFPAGRTGVSEPLVCTGHAGAGDVLFVTYLSGSRVQFGHEDMGSVALTDPVAVDLAKDHAIELSLGSLFPPGWKDKHLSDDEMNWERNRLLIWLDGALLFDSPRHFQPSQPAEVVFAVNIIGASTASEAFSGTLRSVESFDPASRQSRRLLQSWGPLEARIRFPTHVEGRREPLVATGLGGKGDCVFVVYETGDRLRVGFDHWGYGGPVSDAVWADPLRDHHLEISMGSLYPPVGDPEWERHSGARKEALKGTVRVTLDGVVVLQAPLPSYDSRPDQVTPWANYIGSSSCSEKFTGEVESTDRSSW